MSKAKAYTRPAMAPDPPGADVYYWPDFVMSSGGRKAHLERLDEQGLATDVTLCGVKLWGSTQPRFGGVDVCDRCSHAADHFDELAAATPKETT
jgi:hypothetical protein